MDWFGNPSSIYSRVKGKYFDILGKLNKKLTSNDFNVTSVEVMSDGEHTFSVQRTSQGLDSDSENIDFNESFISTQSNLYDNEDSHPLLFCYAYQYFC